MIKVVIRRWGFKMNYENMWNDLKQVISESHSRIKKLKELAGDNQSKIEYGCIIEGLEIARRELISIEKHYTNSDLPRQYAEKLRNNEPSSK
jgi:hypothetical protein